MMNNATAAALAIAAVLGASPASAATTCTGTVRDLRILGDGTVTVIFNTARPNVPMRICNVSRALSNPQQTLGTQGRVVTAEACAGWVATLQSALTRSSPFVDVAYDDTPATITACGLVPDHNTVAPNPVYLPTAVVLKN